MWHYLQEKKKTWLAYPFKRFHLPPPKPNSFTQVLVFKLFTLMSLEFLTSTHSTLFAARLLLPLSLCCKNCKYVKVWSFMSNLSQVQKMIQVHLRVLTSLSVFITSLLWIFRLYLMLWSRIESVELKIFLHVMVKNILMLKKEKKKGKTPSGRKLQFGRNWPQCPKLAEIWSKVEQRLFPFRFAYRTKRCSGSNLSSIIFVIIKLLERERNMVW